MPAAAVTMSEKPSRAYYITRQSLQNGTSPVLSAVTDARRLHAKLLTTMMTTTTIWLHSAAVAATEAVAVQVQLSVCLSVCFTDRS